MLLKRSKAKHGKNYQIKMELLVNVEVLGLLEEKNSSYKSISMQFVNTISVMEQWKKSCQFAGISRKSVRKLHK